MHRCTGNPQECEAPAFCESCGTLATPETPVFVDDEDFLCGECRAKA